MTREERNREASRRYSARNPEKVRAKMAAWREANPEYHSKWHKKNRQERGEELNAKTQAWRDSNPDWHREYREQNEEALREAQLKYKYGISLAEYNAIVDQQGGRCAICGRLGNVGGKRLAVDHCHATGKIRGALCNPCNTVLGRFGDDPNRLMSAAAYLLQNTNLLEVGRVVDAE